MKKITSKSAAKAVKKAPVKSEILESLPVSSPRSFKLWPIIAFIGLVLVVLAYYRFGVVATVNGKPISRFAYLRALEKQDQKQTIKQMTNQALIFQEAAKKGVSIEQSVIDSEIASIEAQIKEQGESLETALAAEGMSRADLVEQITLQKLVEKLTNYQSNITQAQIDDYLKSNKASLPASYTKTQLQDWAKSQLDSEAKSDAVNNWFSELLKGAKIVIR